MGRVLLSPDKQRAIVEAIEKGHTMGSAARAAGVHPSTLKRWLKLGRETRRGKTYRLVRAIEGARAKLREVLDHVEYEIAVDKGVHPGTRLRAVAMIRHRVFGQVGPTASDPGAMDVYHHHRVTVDAGPVGASLIPPRALAIASDADLAELLERLQSDARALPGQIIDAEDDE